jgi:signal transduction histidine kinase
MRLAYRSSIRLKLILLLAGTASAAVLLVGAALCGYELVHARQTLAVEASANAQLVAESSAAALLFNDKSAASDTLTDLRADPRIELACLYTVAGEVLARYSSKQGAPCPPRAEAGLHFTHTYLGVSHPIEAHGLSAGVLYLQISLADMYSSLRDFAEVAFLAIVVASFFALLLASVLQRIISAPILHLTAVATSVSEKRDYYLRARHSQRRGADETSVLIDQFNTMLDRIQQREEELREAHDSLEETVRVRTVDLSNEISERKLVEQSLESARVAAEEANHAKSAFLANMSHELRTPLNAIIGYSEMLYEDAEDAGATESLADLSKVLVSARHLLSLISDILDLSKIEAGQMKVTPEPVQAAVLVNDVLPSAEVLARKNNNDFVLEGGAWDGLIFVDALRFRQALLNLVANACKFTENGTVTLAIAKVATASGEEIQWSVTDTGIGIPPENLSKLFRTFSQVDGSNTRRFGGSGLGLAISQQLCQAMGGHISVESTVGQGSVFTIHIPPYRATQEQRVETSAVVSNMIAPQLPPSALPALPPAPSAPLAAVQQ